MLKSTLNDHSDVVEKVAALHSRGPRKRHRARHTKSRLGCSLCKLRRVKCDEARPVCGSCSSRGEPCSFPNPPAISRRPISSSVTRQESASTQSDDGFSISRSYLKPLGLCMAPLAGVPTPADDNLLDMDNLLAMQFFHLHTAHKMVLQPKRILVWRRVIPDLAERHRFLMHLLLALGGIHMITVRMGQRPSEEDDYLHTVDLRVVMDHHQRGLQGFREELAKISDSNAEAVYSGSLLLVGFIYAFLQVSELNPPASTASPPVGRSVPASNQRTPTIFGRPELSWMHLIRGVTTVIRDQWPALKASRMRPMVLHFHDDEYWTGLPFASSLNRLSHCSSRLLLFAQGASQAVADLKHTHAAVRLADSSMPCLASVSPASSSEGIVDDQWRAIGVLEKLYSRIISVLQCSVSECGSPDDSDIQADFEEAAVLSWPVLVPDDFIGTLDVDYRADLTWGLSLTILAHFYAINILVDRWYLVAFKGEVLKIQQSVCNIHNAELDQLMKWPVKLATA